MRARSLLMAGALVLSFAFASPVRADTIQITDGNAVVVSYLGGDATYDLGAAGFHVSGVATDTGGVLGCFPCAGGAAPISFGWAGDSWGAGPLTVGSTTYSNAWFGGDIHMSGTAMVPASSTAPFDVTFPFTVAAGSFVNAFSDSMRTNQIFTAGLTGSGIATLTLTPAGSSTLFSGQALRFDFGASQTSPTPEPATVLLLGAGFAAAYRARRRLTIG